MELRQLNYFLAIAESGSMSGASSLLNVAQPTLSRHIRRLERDIGVNLFYRHGRGIRLTDEGRDFKDAVGPLVHKLFQVRSDLNTKSKVPSGKVSLALPPSMSAAIGASLVRGFLKNYPRVMLQIMDGYSGYVNEWLVNGRVDMAIVNDSRRSPHLHAEQLVSLDLFLVGHPRLMSQLPRTKSLKLSDISEIPLFLPGRHHGLRRKLDSVAKDIDIHLNIRSEVDSHSTMKDLVRAGMGATISPGGSVFPEATGKALVARRIDGSELSMRFMLAYSLQRPVTLAMRELSRTIRKEIRSALTEKRLVGKL